MQGFVDDGMVAGSVTLVGRHDKVLSLNTVGWADLNKQRRMRPDNLFWIASMTKPITVVAVLMLQDEHKLSKEDPVEKYLPEFKRQWLIREKSNTLQSLSQPSRPITLRDLLTHTSGIGDVGAPRPSCFLAELVMAYSQQPLRFPPASKWEYSNAGINSLGRIVEVASGLSFQTFLRRWILQPLDMKDTTFWPTSSQIQRIDKPYKPSADGKGLDETEIYFIKGSLSDRRRTPFPAGGLFSTAEDMGRFYQMMLSEGGFRGKRLLSPDAVCQLTRIQTGDIKTGFVDGMSFGLGFAVVKEPQGMTSMLSLGTFGHGGAYATQSWADPKQDLVLILMIQRAGFPNGDNSPVRMAFQEAAISAYGR